MKAMWLSLVAWELVAWELVTSDPKPRGKYT